MMAAQMYRVVETKVTKEGQVQIDIGCLWKPEKKAKEEMRALKLQNSGRWLSIQKQGK